jgi:hypothetical protein
LRLSTTQNITLLEKEAVNSGPTSDRLRQLFGVIGVVRAQHRLEKRLSTADWNAAVNAGRLLECLLEADADGATKLLGRSSQSPWTDFKSLADYGYVAEQWPGDWYSTRRLEKASSDLGFSTAVPNPMMYIKIEQSDPWVSNNKVIDVSPVRSRSREKKMLTMAHSQPKPNSRICTILKMA